MVLHLFSSFPWLHLVNGYSCVFQRRNNFNQGRRRLNGKAFRAQRDDSIRQTVYVSDIDQNVSFKQWHLSVILFIFFSVSL